MREIIHLLIPRRRSLINALLRVWFQSFLSQCLICPNGFTNSCGVCNGFHGVTANQNKNDSHSPYPRKSNKCQCTQWVNNGAMLTGAWIDGFRGSGVRQSVHGCSDPLGAVTQGGGGGPSSPMVRLRRHHKLRENFLENQKPNGYTAPTLHISTTRDSITAL